jgi:hypothetical protein
VGGATRDLKKLSLILNLDWLVKFTRFLINLNIIKKINSMLFDKKKYRLNSALDILGKI